MDSTEDKKEENPIDELEKAIGDTGDNKPVDNAAEPTSETKPAEPVVDEFDFADMFSLQDKEAEKPVVNQQPAITVDLLKAEAEKLGLSLTPAQAQQMVDDQTHANQQFGQQRPVFDAPYLRDLETQNPVLAKAVREQGQQALDAMVVMRGMIDELKTQTRSSKDDFRSVLEEERKQERERQEQAEKARKQAEWRAARDQGMAKYQEELKATANELLKAGYTKEEVNQVILDAAEKYSVFTPHSAPVKGWKNYDPKKIADDPLLGSAMSLATKIARWERGLYTPTEAKKVAKDLLRVLKGKTGVASSSANLAPGLSVKQETAHRSGNVDFYTAMLAASKRK